MSFNPTAMEIVASVLMLTAIFHTFMVKMFEKWSHRCKTEFWRGSLHYLSEAEIVFGFWAAILFAAMCVGYWDHHQAAHYIGGLDYTEPKFVFVIMAMASTRPICDLADRFIAFLARIIPLDDSLTFFIIALIMGPILGSFITEPAAMTVTALLLKRRYFDRDISKSLKYATLGLLFVNVSIGGTLTNFAAPPVLMVAKTWGWSSVYMIANFGYKAAISVIICTLGVAVIFWKELKDLPDEAPAPTEEEKGLKPVPKTLYLFHVLCIAAVVLFSHDLNVFLGIFMVFFGVYRNTMDYQTPIKLKESLLVGFFLAGLVTLGGWQKWWLQPLIGGLDSLFLFFGATVLTAFTDNAALTYLGSLVEGMSESSQYALVAGAVAGGGLTVIANAPNPAGFALLKDSFGEGGISFFGLVLGAILPTLVAMGCLWLLPNLA